MLGGIALFEKRDLCGSLRIHRPQTPSSQRHILAAQQAEKVVRVGVALFRWNIALYDGNTLDGNLGRIECQHDSKTILWIAAKCPHRGVCINDDSHDFLAFRTHYRNYHIKRVVAVRQC